jgi:CHAT domain-containing protein
MNPRARLAAIAAAAILLAPGGASAREGLTYLEGASRFADMVTGVEERIAEGAKPNADLVGPLCLAYGRLKRYSKLFECLDRLEELIRQGDSKIHGDYGIVPVTVDAVPLVPMLRAEALLDLGRYRESYAIASTALDALPKGDGMFTTSTWPTLRLRMAYLGTAVIAAALGGDQANAEARLKELEDIDLPFVGAAMTKGYKANALARAYMVMGRYKEALSHLGGPGGFDRLARGAADLFNPFAWRGDSVSTTIEMPRVIMASKALSETGDTESARKLLDAALAEPRLADMGELHWLALYERGRIAERDGKLEDATEFYRRAIELIELQRSSITSDANRIGFVGDKQALYARAIAVAVELKRPAQAFDFVERSKSRALVDLLATKKDFAVRGADEGKARAVLGELLKADADAASGEPVGPAQSGTRTAKALREQIQSIAPELSTLVTVSSVASSELQSLLSPTEALVEYFFEGDNLYVFVLTREELVAVRGSAAGINQQVQRLRRALALPDAGDWKSSAKALHRQLIAPVGAKISGKQLVVVPHGALHYLPFAVLVDAEDQFVLDRTSLRVLPSASVLKFLRPSGASRNSPALIFGNPDLGKPELDLHFAEGEARALGTILPGSRVLVRANASKSNFRALAGGFSRIHFATHGKFNADSPLDSGLYLARGSESSGVLTVGELYSMKVDVDLVSLSACETGLGKVSSGDDVVGLTRGFLYAGSRSIVASLWSVDDQATGELMRAFYENLQQYPKSEALRRAQLSTRARFPHPFFWGAFQVIGRND